MSILTFMENESYTQIRLSGEVVKHIDIFLKKHPFFSNRTDFVKHCIRSYIEKNNGGNENYQKDEKV